MVYNGEKGYVTYCERHSIVRGQEPLLALEDCRGADAVFGQCCLPAGRSEIVREGIGGCGIISLTNKSERGIY